jgi:bisphosphoglycerate-dependent phosphoglycerate mutase
MTSSLDTKALATIAFLMDRRETWSIITCGDLAKRLNHARHGLTGILDRVGTWCFSIHKQSLAVLVISEQGEPNEGMYNSFKGETGPVTKENYERRRVQLWREDWSEVAVPTPEEIAVAYEKFKA